ncbi:hypothetical protein AGLY_010481 [Aphis glycines]|uniref:Uncharacterized protein n=1 Tax=Aphis glycines TaxID=307491 RepID=A0A6G0TDV6_APHGL|nr:hypothetical protein AGLY_010481 [Aphis glycines]
MKKIGFTSVSNHSMNLYLEFFFVKTFEEKLVENVVTNQLLKNYLTDFYENFRSIKKVISINSCTMYSIKYIMHEFFLKNLIFIATTKKKKIKNIVQSDFFYVKINILLTRKKFNVITLDVRCLSRIFQPLNISLRLILLGQSKNKSLSLVYIRFAQFGTGFLGPDSSSEESHFGSVANFGADEVGIFEDNALGRITDLLFSASSASLRLALISANLSSASFCFFNASSFIIISFSFCFSSFFFFSSAAFLTLSSTRLICSSLCLAAHIILSFFQLHFLGFDEEFEINDLLLVLLDTLVFFASILFSSWSFLFIVLVICADDFSSILTSISSNFSRQLEFSTLMGDSSVPLSGENIPGEIHSSTFCIHFLSTTKVELAVGQAIGAMSINLLLVDAPEPLIVEDSLTPFILSDAIYKCSKLLKACLVVLRIGGIAVLRLTRLSFRCILFRHILCRLFPLKIKHSRTRPCAMHQC